MGLEPAAEWRTWQAPPDQAWAIVAIDECEAPTDDRLYWSNDQGWVSSAEADRFTHADTARLRLPQGGAWVPMDWIAVPVVRRGNEFTRDEVDSIYVHCDERYVVSLIVGYLHDPREVVSPKAAAAAALELTRDGAQERTTWFVYDRQTRTMHEFEQGSFDLELCGVDFVECDECGHREYDGAEEVPMCGNCGNCQVHCAHYKGCGLVPCPRCGMGSGGWLGFDSESDFYACRACGARWREGDGR